MMLVQPNQEQQAHIRTIFNENPETRDADVQHIKNWLKEQPHLPDISDEHCLLMFLRGCQFSMEICKKKLETYFTSRTIYPEFFEKRNIRSPELQEICELMDAAVLPDLTPSGYRVSVARAAKTDFETPNISDLIKIVFMVGDLRLILEKTGVCDIYIADINFPITKHFFKVNPMVLKKMFTCIQEAYPVLIKEIHLVNASPFIEFMLNVIKPFMSAAMQETIHVHTNIETLYEFVPKSILPEEFGGSAGKLGKFKRQWIETLEEYSEWFEKQEMIKADLTKKINDRNGFGFDNNLCLIQ